MGRIAQGASADRVRPVSSPTHSKASATTCAWNARCFRASRATQGLITTSTACARRAPFSRLVVMTRGLPTRRGTWASRSAVGKGIVLVCVCGIKEGSF